MNLNSHFKGEKLNIHMFYWILILVLIIIGLITTRSYSNESLAEQVAFGATLSGIILSVIAIIMTLIGESKSDNTKDKLINLSDNLEEIVQRVEKTTIKLEDVVNINLDVKSKIDTLGSQISEISFTHVDTTQSVEDSKEIENEYISIFDKFCMGFRNNPAFVRSACFALILFHKNVGKPFSYDDFLKKADELNINLQYGQTVWGVSLIFNPGIHNIELANYILNYSKKNFDINYDKILEKLIL